MRKAADSLVVLAAAAIAACSAPQTAADPAPTAADSAAVRTIGDAYEIAWAAGDASALGQLVTENYYGVEPDGTILNGRAAFEGYEKASADSRKGSTMALDIAPGNITFVNSSTASSSGTWTLKGAPPGSGPDKGSYLAISVKGADGKWRMQSALAAAYVPPPAAPPTGGKGGQ